MQDLNVAIIQTTLEWEDKEKNLSHFNCLIEKQLKGKQVDLLVLPEMFNTGFTMNAKKLAEKMDGSTVSWMKEKAQDLDCEVGGSIIIEEEGQFFNRFLIVDQNQIKVYYDKRHLFRMADEHKHYSAGKRRVVYTLNGWRILLQVCYDLRFPVFSRNRTIDGKKEYDLSIYIANWPEKRNQVWKILLQARAAENQAYCLGLNRIGVDGNDISYSGDSMLVDPWGTIQQQFAEKKESVKILTLDSSVIEHLNERFPAFKDADSFNIHFNQ
ncbi:MAG: amidohydrolase [Crocinitomicaceae bacterium]